MSGDYLTRAEFDEHRRESNERHERVERAMRVLEQDWIDTQRLLPSRPDIERIESHLAMQDWILWSIAIAVIAGLIVGIVVLK